MNEDMCVKIVGSSLLTCCDSGECKGCKPAWQRTIVVSDTEGVVGIWFPVCGLRNDALKKMAKSKHGLLIENNTGVWYLSKKMAYDVAGTASDRAHIDRVAALVEKEYREQLAKKEGNACAEDQRNEPS